MTDKIFHNDDDYVPLEVIYDLLDSNREQAIHILRNIEGEENVAFEAAKIIGALHILDSLSIDIRNKFKHAPYVGEENDR